MIDLHMHTNVSDGYDSPEELLKKCEEAGLSIISITDHNTVGQYEELAKINTSTLFSGKIIKGIELDTVIDGLAIELLVYDYDIAKMKSWVENRYKSRAERQVITFNAVCEKCREHNIKIQELEWNPDQEYAHSALYRMIMACEENRDHPALQMDSYREFYRVCSTDRHHPLYVDLSIVYASIDEVVDIAKYAGGKVFLAHIFYYNIENKEEFLNDMFQRYNLDGVEVYHYSFTEEQIDWLQNYCYTNKLLMSGGSDYHGEGARDCELGVGKGLYTISEKLIEDWYSEL